MTILEHIEKIEALVIEHTKPVSVSNIRNHLMVVREQVEALLASNATLKNENAVIKNVAEHKEAQAAEAYEKLQTDYAALIATQSDGGLLSQYVSDLEWPGTAIHNDSKKRVCEPCLKTKKVDLALVWDRVNQLWTCPGCGGHRVKP